MKRLALPMTFSILLAACSDLNDALNIESKRRPANVPGIASTTDIEDVQSAAGGTAPPSPPAQQPTPPVQPKAAAQPPQGTGGATPPVAGQGNPPPAQQPAPPPAKQTFVGRMTAHVINYAEYRKNPFIVVVENRVQGKDPLSIAASAYVAATSRASVRNFKHQLDLIKATNGKPPTFVEFQKLSKKLRIEMAKLPPYQAYAYDETTGGLLIVENKKYKIELYNKAGVAIEAADRKYEQLLKSQRP
ncbi:MAG: hypothetical protein QF363_10075 [Planctomycetaceae bacterium]|nr:hypothetical protein [Planctomycetaceae bacterium]